MTTLILDGYNVAHAVPEIARHLDRDLQAARDALVALCQAYRAKRGDIGKVVIVFDGRGGDASGPREQSQGGMTLVFSQKPEEADQRILRVIESHRGHCVVVSNDNEVANNARAFGAGILSVREFAAQARQGTTRRAASGESAPKASLPANTARKITEDYLKHLEKRRKA